MKWLVSIAVVQTLLIIVLVFQVMGLKKQPITSVTTTLPVNVSQTAESIQGTSVPATSPVALSENQIRNIIRQELAAQFMAQDNEHAARPAQDQPDPVSAAEYQRRLEIANQQLEYFVAQGEITSAEMAELQTNIARLDTQSRRDLLNLLSRLMASGEIDGQF